MPKSSLQLFPVTPKNAEVVKHGIWSLPPVAYSELIRARSGEMSSTSFFAAVACEYQQPKESVLRPNSNRLVCFPINVTPAITAPDNGRIGYEDGGKIAADLFNTLSLHASNILTVRIFPFAKSTRQTRDDWLLDKVPALGHLLASREIHNAHNFMLLFNPYVR